MQFTPLAASLDPAPGSGLGWGGLYASALTDVFVRLLPNAARHAREGTLWLSSHHDDNQHRDEAVGLNHYDDCFAAVDRLLAPDAVMPLQTVTVSTSRFGRAA